MCVRACLCVRARAHTHMQACTHTHRYVPSLMATHSRTHRLPSRIHVLKNGPAQFLVLGHRPLSQSFVKSRALLPAGHCLILGHKGKEDRPALGPGSAALCSGQRSAPVCVCVWPALGVGRGARETCSPSEHSLFGDLGAASLHRASTVCLALLEIGYIPNIAGNSKAAGQPPCAGLVSGKRCRPDRPPPAPRAFAL